MQFTPLVLCSLLAAQKPPAPQTVPEATEYSATSRAADVERFCEDVLKLPHGDRLQVRTAGKTTQDRAQLLVKIALPPGNGKRVRALLIGNIHAGEVEGKEALQVLLREFANGEHEDLLQRCELWFLPIYNVDGNEAVGPKNRPGQNGPEITGQRANAKGLDLNRDFVKLDAPETRTLVGLFAEIDPHLFVDLHTTNGSYHGYHLTYAPSLSPNVDPDLAHLSRALLDSATAAMKDQHQFATFDYGNFETRDWDGGGAPESPKVRGWFSYDHRARYGVNYFGLRNRIGILSEAYSYCDFRTRIAATRAFVLCLLDGLARSADQVLGSCAAADRRVVEPEQPVSFGFDTTFGEPEKLPVLVGEVDKVPATGEGTDRFVRKGDGVPETMPVCRSFRARKQLVLPMAWAIAEPTPDVLDRLRRHGIQFQQIDAGRKVVAERFAVTAKKKPKRPYQGHQELVLDGQWQPPAPAELQKGAIVVTARQPLARLAAQLLEPQSEDSLSSWNFFESQTTDLYPVLRLVE